MPHENPASDALEMVCDIDLSDDRKLRATLEELAKVCLSLWGPVSYCSVHHQDVFAVFENGVVSACKDNALSYGQLAAFRHALILLECSTLQTDNVVLLRARFRREGFGALAFLSGA